MDLGAETLRGFTDLTSAVRQEGRLLESLRRAVLQQRQAVMLGDAPGVESSVRHAGTTPAVLSRPRVGLSPTISLKAAGTRPDPAVSVPSANATSPSATDTADPELEPPDTCSALNTLEHAPYGLRVPTSPVAN